MREPSTLQNKVNIAVLVAQMDPETHAEVVLTFHIALSFPTKLSQYKEVRTPLLGSPNAAGMSASPSGSCNSRKTP